MAASDDLVQWFQGRTFAVHTNEFKALKTLAGANPHLRRRWLRPHEEAGILLAEMVDVSDLEKWSLLELRNWLDKGLDRLTQIESGFQLGILAADNMLDTEIQSQLIELIQDEAFIHYVDVYDFFGIRFLCARHALLREAAEKERLDSQRERSEEERKTAAAVELQPNLPDLLLAVPPSLEKLPEELIKWVGRLDSDQSDDVRDEKSLNSVQKALRYLDGYWGPYAGYEGAAPRGGYSGVQRRFELWLRGLLPETEGVHIPIFPGENQPPPEMGECLFIKPSPDELEEGQYFEQLRKGLAAWALSRASVYSDVAKWEHKRRTGREPNFTGLFDAKRMRHRGNVGADVPVNAKLALMDFYYLAKILRAEVTPMGGAVYREASWLSLMAARATRLCEMNAAQELRIVESLLRAVFCATCELIQNAAELRDQEVRKQVGECVASSANVKLWRKVFDDELATIERQRVLRTYGEPKPLQDGGLGADDHGGWSRRVVEGGSERNLIGLALSGGGVRSATFGLGVLQALQELDVLRKVDYLSTVSGGGFVGGWLLGNVRRTKYWLGSHTCWDDSIRHLRAYSNYLTPRSGILSMDTWSMGVSWVRNTLLMQLSLFATLLSAFGAVYVMRHAFVAAANESRLIALTYQTPLDLSQLTTMLLATCVVCMLMFSIAPAYPPPAIQQQVDVWRRRCAMAVLPACLLSCVLAAWSLILHYKLRDCLITRHHMWWPLVWGLVAFCAWFAGKVYRKRECRTFYARRGATRWLAMVPGWLAVAILASRIFGKVTAVHGESVKTSLKMFGLTLHVVCAPQNDYSKMLNHGLNYWWLTLLLSAIGFVVLTRATLLAAYRWGDMRSRTPSVWRRWWGPVGCAVLCTLVLHLCFTAIAWAIVNVSNGMLRGRQGGLENAVFTFGPALTMLSYSLAILLMIGLCGKYSDESQREWWTRFGAWTLALSLVGLLVPAIVFGGPWAMARVMSSEYAQPIKWTAVISWMASTVGALFAGKSSKASDDAPNRSVLLQYIAKLGSLIFVLGTALGTAEVLFIFFRTWVPNVKGASSVAYGVSWWTLLITLGILALCTGLFTWAFELNIFGFSQFYRNRLVRCFLGATRWRPGLRKPDPFTKFDFVDDVRLVNLGPQSGPNKQDAEEFRGPYPLLNCTLNLAGSDDVELHTRHSASFLLSPGYCGSSRPLVNYKPTSDFACGDVKLGQAIAVSGAAASPNMGYNTSPLVAFMLTIFNVRLGWWFPNPSSKTGRKVTLSNSLPYLFMELLGEANETKGYLNISDGGHFENLGIYELVRRGCKLIIVSDAECDEEMVFGGLANAIRLCATDFGAKIDLDVSSIHPKEGDPSLMHAAMGTIRYSNGSVGRILYLKSSLTGDEDVTVGQYKASHPTFPHETTANQFFTEDQFESYRRLGMHVVHKAFAGIGEDVHPLDAADRMADTLAPASRPSEVFLRHAAKLQEIWEKVRSAGTANGSLLNQLMGTWPIQATPLTDEISLIGLEIFQFMETVYMDLRLDDFWEHPDNRGWTMLFMEWGRSPVLRTVWKQRHRTFGIRFEYFCDRRLGLFSDNPVARIDPVPV